MVKQLFNLRSALESSPQDFSGIGEAIGAIALDLVHMSKGESVFGFYFKGQHYEYIQNKNAS